MLPVNPAVEALLTSARGRVAAGNASRRELALLSALGLTRSGLSDSADIALRPQTSAGFAEAPTLMNDSFGLQVGPEGQAFRDARTGIADAFGSRGTLFGSEAEYARVDAERALQQQIADAMRGFDAAQASSISDQGDVLRDLAGQISLERQAQAEALAAEPVAPEPEPGAGSTAPGQPAAGGGGGGGAPAQARRQILGRYGNRGYALRAARQRGGGAQVRQRIVTEPGGGRSLQYLVGTGFRPQTAAQRRRGAQVRRNFNRPNARIVQPRTGGQTVVPN